MSLYKMSIKVKEISLVDHLFVVTKLLGNNSYAI